jgi:ethanolamine utilization protein EutN
MIRGRVIGEIWATQKCPSLSGRKLLMVAPYEADESNAHCLGNRVVVALDLLNSSVGEDVMVSFGSGARNALSPGDNRRVLADAAVSKIVDVCS